MLQASGTQVSKEHQGSSTKGNSRSAKTSCAHSTSKEDKRNKSSSGLSPNADSTCSFRLIFFVVEKMKSGISKDHPMTVICNIAITCLLHQNI